MTACIIVNRAQAPRRGCGALFLWRIDRSGREGRGDRRACGGERSADKNVFAALSARCGDAVAVNGGALPGEMGAVRTGGIWWRSGGTLMGSKIRPAFPHGSGARGGIGRGRLGRPGGMCPVYGGTVAAGYDRSGATDRGRGGAGQRGRGAFGRWRGWWAGRLAGTTAVFWRADGAVSAPGAGGLGDLPELLGDYISADTGGK